jgi:hypothetical protein
MNKARGQHHDYRPKIGWSVSDIFTYQGGIAQISSNPMGYAPIGRHDWVLVQRLEPKEAEIMMQPVLGRHVRAPRDEEGVIVKVGPRWVDAVYCQDRKPMLIRYYNDNQLLGEPGQVAQVNEVAKPGGLVWCFPTVELAGQITANTLEIWADHPHFLVEPMEPLAVFPNRKPHSKESFYAPRLRVLWIDGHTTEGKLALNKFGVPGGLWTPGKQYVHCWPYEPTT